MSLRRRGGRLCSNVRTLEQGARRITAPPRPFERPGPVTR
ncbi:transcriptional regulator, partial [Burkholderia pseudomallei]